MFPTFTALDWLPEVVFPPLESILNYRRKNFINVGLKKGVSFTNHLLILFPNHLRKMPSSYQDNLHNIIPAKDTEQPLSSCGCLCSPYQGMYKLWSQSAWFQLSAPPHTSCAIFRQDTYTVLILK